MSNDTPDYARGSVNPQRLISNYPGGILNPAVTVPGDAVALWVFISPTQHPATLTVVGLTSSINYPVYRFPVNNAGSGQPAALVLVSPTRDPVVRFTWNTAPGDVWTIVGDSGPHITVDPYLAASVAAPGAVNPGSAIVAAGSDGANVRALLTDSTGRLVTVGGTYPPTYGVPGAAAPADAEQVGGTDGANLRALLTDTAGHLLTIDQTLKLAIAVLGAALPADAVLAAGSDGANLRALLTDATGKLLTIDQTLKLALAARNAAIPADALQVGGSDGTSLRALRTDQRGVPYGIASAPDTATGDRPPTEIQYINADNLAAPTVVLAAPGAGLAYRLFFINAYSRDAAADYVVSFNGAAGNALLFCPALASITAQPTPPPAVLPLTGLLVQVNTGITLFVASGHSGVTIGYTIETV